MLPFSLLFSRRLIAYFSSLTRILQITCTIYFVRIFVTFVCIFHVLRRLNRLFQKYNISFAVWSSLQMPKRAADQNIVNSSFQLCAEKPVYAFYLLLKHLVRMVKGFLNIPAEVFSSHEIHKSGFLHGAHRLLVDMGQDQGDSVLFAALVEGCHGVHRCAVRRWNRSHTKDQASCDFVHLDLVDAVSRAEE